MWLFPWLSYAAIGAMAAVLIAMAFTPGLQRDFKASCITLVVAILASRLVVRARRRRSWQKLNANGSYPRISVKR
jgi:L-asparagine transporter-like permease